MPGSFAPLNPHFFGSLPLQLKALLGNYFALALSDLTNAIPLDCYLR